MTRDFVRRKDQWKDYFTGDTRLEVLKGAYHFCLNTHAQEITEKIRRWDRV